jgi:hypothetical protein
LDSVSCNVTLGVVLDSTSCNGTLGDHRHRTVFNQDAVLDSASCTLGDRRRVFNHDNVSRRNVGFGLMDSASCTLGDRRRVLNQDKVSRRNVGFGLMDSVGAILPTNKLNRTYRNN